METQEIEYKESWRDEYLKWICGFANASGGKLFVGVRDNGTVCGVMDAKKLMEDIPNKVRDLLGILVEVNLHTEENKEYLEIVNGGVLPEGWTAETLLKPHRSQPYNPNIANTFFRAGEIEACGPSLHSRIPNALPPKLPPKLPIRI